MTVNCTLNFKTYQHVHVSPMRTFIFPFVNTQKYILYQLGITCCIHSYGAFVRPSPFSSDYGCELWTHIRAMRLYRCRWVVVPTINRKIYLIINYIHLIWQVVVKNLMAIIRYFPHYDVMIFITKPVFTS